MTHLKGLTTMVLTAEDVDAAVDWYRKALGIEPYFRRPQSGPAAYVEFRVGPDEDELGIMDRSYAPKAPEGVGTSVTHWFVDDVEATLKALVSAGAREHEPVIERGVGFITASIIDPFGNVIGLMYSSHWAGRHGLA